MGPCRAAGTPRISAGPPQISGGLTRMCHGHTSYSTTGDATAWLRHPHPFPAAPGGGFGGDKGGTWGHSPSVPACCRCSRRSQPNTRSREPPLRLARCRAFSASDMGAAGPPVPSGASHAAHGPGGTAAVAGAPRERKRGGPGCRSGAGRRRPRSRRFLLLGASKPQGRARAARVRTMLSAPARPGALVHGGRARARSRCLCVLARARQRWPGHARACWACSCMLGALVHARVIL